MKILDVLTSPWAMMPDKLQEITDIYSRHLKGDKIDIKAIEAKAGMAFENKPQGYDVIDGVAVIPIHGVIAKRMNMMQAISGGASTEMIGRDINDALNDADVHSIVLDIDSPGGTVDGTADLGELIFASRGTKPIVSLANGLMASAAYWMGAAADRAYIANSTTTVGSIGVVATHADYSEQLKKDGVVVTEIYAGEYKRISSEYKTLSPEGKQTIQDQVDYLYSVFVNAVSKYRGVDADSVISDMADGRLFIGQQSVDAGLVDGVTTLQALIGQLNGGDALSSIDMDMRAIAALETDLETSTMNITKSNIAENHADIADSFREEGASSVDTTKVAADAAQGERDRVQAVFAQSMPGHEALIDGMAFDGVTTGPEAAVKILQAERGKSASVVADLAADAADIDVSASVDSEPAKIDSNLPTDKRCKAEWDKDASLRAEFNNDLDAYTAFATATEAGQVKILTGGK